MAPTCDLMIKIVKVNKLYLNSLLVSIVNRVSRSGRMKYQYENTDESNKKWLLKEGTFFIAGRGVGRGILEIFCKKSRGPPTSQNGLVHDPSHIPKQKHLTLPPPPPRQK